MDSIEGPWTDTASSWGGGANINRAIGVWPRCHVHELILAAKSIEKALKVFLHTLNMTRPVSHTAHQLEAWFYLGGGWFHQMKIGSPQKQYYPGKFLIPQAVLPPNVPVPHSK